jgi:hypothetical protein
MRKFIQLVDRVGLAEFCCLQDETVWPGVIEVDADDPRYLTYLESLRPVPLVESDAIERAWRDAEIVRVVWVRDRHRDEVELAVPTTITAEQYTELLAYIRALRDWPAGAEFPAVDHRPPAPEWIVEQTE